MPTPLEILKERMMPSDADAMKCCSNEWCGRYHNEEFNSEITQLTIKLLEGEIERKNKLLKLIGKPEGFGEVQTWAKGRRELVEEDIAYIESQLSEIKKI